MKEQIDVIDEPMIFPKKPIEDIEEEAKKLRPDVIGTEVLTWVIGNVENFIDNQSKIFNLDLVMDNVQGMSETKKLQDLYRAIPDDDEHDTPLIPGDEKLPSFIKEKEELGKRLEKAEKCRRMLDEVTSSAFDHIKESKDMLKQLFDRMIFYYEKIIPNPKNKKRALIIDEELKRLIKQKDECVSVESKKEVQDKIVAKIKEGESLIKFEEFVGAAAITNFEYEAFSVGVKMVEGHNPNMDDNGNEIETETPDEDRKVMKQYTIPEGFTVWIEISFKPKMRQTTLF